MRQIFDAAMDRPGEERGAFVRTAAGGDEEIIAEVLKLLHSSFASDSFLNPGTQPLPSQIGRYVVEGELGRGAMGVVYKARDPLIDRPVALKTIHLESLSDPGQADFLRDRLFQEARLAGSLLHPNIVVIFDVGKEGELGFIAMELVDGPSLHRVLGSGRKLERNEILYILRQMAGALDYAHQHSILHRDIKPGNVILHQGSTVKITDFGIAKLATSGVRTRTGLVLGTPSYMSPEQIEGRTLDGRSDQFSLAVVAYQMVTGSLPFEGESLATLLHRIVHSPRPSAVAANPNLPREVDAVLTRGLQSEREQRFATCAEFVDALDRAWLPVAAPPPVVAQVRKPHRWIWMAVPAALLAAVMGVAFWLPRRGAEKVPAAAPTAVGSTTNAGEGQPSFKPSPMATKSASKASDAPAPVPGGVTTTPDGKSVIAAPVIEMFRAEPPAVQPGQSFKLAWQASGAYHIEVDQGIGRVENPGSRTLSVQSPTTYKLKATGDGGTVEHAVTVNIVQPAAKNAQALYEEAMSKLRARSAADALPLFRQAAEMGEARAALELGKAYNAGTGTGKDAAEAARWFRKAADGGNSSGMVLLGALYAQGSGVAKSYSDAIAWFRKGADANNPVGMDGLGQMYAKGLGVPRDTAEAARWFQKAAALGNRDARAHLQEVQASGGMRIGSISPPSVSTGAARIYRITGEGFTTGTMVTMDPPGYVGSRAASAADSRPALVGPGGQWMSVYLAAPAGRRSVRITARTADGKMASVDVPVQ